MNTSHLIPIQTICTHYKVEMSFFNRLSDIGLIEIVTIEKSPFIYQDKMNEIEKMIRMYDELDVNIEGIDIVFNLLQKIDTLQNELLDVHNRLRFYEE